MADTSIYLKSVLDIAERYFKTIGKSPECLYASRGWMRGHLGGWGIKETNVYGIPIKEFRHKSIGDFVQCIMTSLEPIQNPSPSQADPE